MRLVERLRAKVNSTMVPIHLGNGQIINGSGLGSDSASPRLRNEAADKIVEQAARIEELEGTIRRNLPHLNYALDSLINDGIHPGTLPGIYSRLLNTQDTQDT